MPERSLLFVANWKMQLSFDESLQFCEDHEEELAALDASCAHRLVLCPSFPALYPIATILRVTSIALGAQQCSSYRQGAYTGEVSAQTLAQVGCSYCIVGHSERRRYFYETSKDIAEKVVQLSTAGINPIICIGEERGQYESKKTFSVLDKQLAPIINHLQTLEIMPAHIYIAYEPVWAIGTGNIPTTSYLDEIFNYLAEYCFMNLPDVTHSSFLYGGSVNEETIVPLSTLDWLNGFLIGGASLDFQKFKNMISLCM